MYNNNITYGVTKGQRQAKTLTRLNLLEAETESEPRQKQAKTKSEPRPKQAKT